MGKGTSKLKTPKSGAKKKGFKSLGPVLSLEDHVTPDWWCRLFTSNYLKTDADVVDDLRLTRGEVERICQILELSKDDRILDLCCGQGRHTLELSRRGFRNVEGLDRSHYLIRKAKERAQKENLGPKFREGDARKLPYPADSFDAVLILGNSFGYFETLKDDLLVLKQAKRLLKPWGKIFIDIADGDYLREHFQSRSWEWINKNLFVCRERSLSLDGGRLISREVITHVGKGVLADQFYAERLYSRDSLSNLLNEARFSDIVFPDSIVTDSSRGQDLGMMERRVIGTARIIKEWAPAKQKPKQSDKHVAVLLGDPLQPDLLKPKSVFDEDDFFTIDKMKAALKELPGYHFSFLDNHNTLIQDIQKLTGSVDYVFNLCDEGYHNDPRKELHVPSLLESVDIPYTGSGPQCLAYCYDKSLIRGLAEEMKVPVPQALLIQSEDMTFELPFEFPVIVKPNFGDSSFGITARSVAYNAEDLINAIQEIRGTFGYEKPILVEEFLTENDLSVGIIGNPPTSYIVLPIIEEDYSAVPKNLPRICGYEAKWLPDSPYWNVKSKPAKLDSKVEEAIVEWCIILAERLECRDYVRLDWRISSSGAPKLLEVNPNPGWCWDGHLAKMAGLAGMAYPDMLKAILRAAEERLGIDNFASEDKIKQPDIPIAAGVRGNSH